MPTQSVLVALVLSAAAFAQSTTWTFDNIHRIGGHATEVLGDPKVIDTPLGKAILFDGKDDAIYVPTHPLADAATFTWEAIFRPDGGAFEQRWFHLAEQANGTDTGNRMLFEIRVTNGQWYLDSFAATKTGSKALLNKDHLHPTGEWYHVASVYDGKTFRNYVNGKLEGSAEVQFAPQGNGRTSIGVRINKVNYFQGAIHLSRFTKRALTPGEFLPWPKAAAQDAAWKASIPLGQSSPIRARRRVFTTAAEGNTLLMIRASESSHHHSIFGWVDRNDDKLPDAAKRPSPRPPSPTAASTCGRAGRSTVSALLGSRCPRAEGKHERFPVALPDGGGPGHGEVPGFLGDGLARFQCRRIEHRVATAGLRIANGSVGDPLLSGGARLACQSLRCGVVSRMAPLCLPGVERG